MAYYFKVKKPTIIFLGDAAVEEDYVLGAMGWASKKKLPLIFVVEDNNMSTNSNTTIAWGKKQRVLPNVKYYKYKRKFPHHGIGRWILF